MDIPIPKHYISFWLFSLTVIKMKILVLLISIGVALAWEPTPDERDLLANTPYAYLPQGLKDAIKKSKLSKRQEDAEAEGAAG